MLEFYIMIVLAVLVSLGFVLSWSAKRPLFSFWFKGVATVFVIALCGIAMFVNTGITISSIFIVIALGFCLLGDLTLALLELLDATKKDNVITFGMFSFGLAQICFIIAMSLSVGFMPFAILGGIAFAGIVFLMSKPLKLNFGKCLIPTLVYSFLVSTSLFSAITLMVLSGFTGAGIILTIAFASFIISDLILSQIYFGQGNKAPLYIPNLATYYAAIILIACATLTLV